MRRIENRLQPRRNRAAHILLTVVDEEHIRSRTAETFHRMDIDRRIRLDDLVPVRPSVMREAADPVELLSQAEFHRIADVGKNAGLDAALL